MKIKRSEILLFSILIILMPLLTGNLIHYRPDDLTYSIKNNILYAEYEDLKCNITFSEDAEIKIDKVSHGIEFSYIMDMPDKTFEPKIQINCNGVLDMSNDIITYKNFQIDFNTLKQEVDMSKYADLKPGQNQTIKFELTSKELSKTSYEFSPTIDTKYSIRTGDKIILDPTITITDFDSTDIETINITIESNFSHLGLSPGFPYDSLIAYWNFDGDEFETYGFTAHDYTGNNDGIGNGTSAVVSCLYDDCAEFDGDGDYIVVPHDDSLNVSSEYTSSAWVKLNSLSSSYVGVISKGNYVNYMSSVINTDDFYCYMGNGSNAQVVGDYNVLDLGWHHVVCVYNGTHIIPYVDGTKGTPTAKTITDAFTDKGTLQIGAREGVNSFNGSIDEVMIFNKSLNSSQVSDIFNNQSARFLTSGEQKNMTFNMSLDSDWIYLAFPGSEENLGSSLQYSIGEYNSSSDAYDYGIWKDFSDPYYQVSDYTLINFSLAVRFTAGTNNFYSPILKTSVSSPISGATNSSITNCSYLLTEGTTYLLENDIEDNDLSSNCIVILNQNISLDCQGNGILSDDTISAVYSNQDNTTIQNCNISAKYGIYLEESNNSCLYNNSLTKNTAGLYVTKSSNLIINKTTTSHDTISIGFYNSMNNSMIETSVWNSTIAFFIQNLDDSTFDDLIINLSTTGITLNRFGADNSINNRFQDIYLTNIKTTNLSVAYSTNITFLNASYSSGTTSTEGELIRKWYLKVYVNDTNSGNSIEGVNLTFHNNSDTFNFNSTTNSEGYTDLEEIIDYINNAGTITYHSLYNVYLKNDSYNLIMKTYNATSNKNNYNYTISLDNLPPNITLISPVDGTMDTDGIIRFVFTPSDINLDNCSLNYQSGEYTKMTSVTNNIQNILEVVGIDAEHPLYSDDLRWYISCIDNQNNVDNSSVHHLDTKESVYGGGTAGGAVSHDKNPKSAEIFYPGEWQRNSNILVTIKVYNLEDEIYIPEKVYFDFEIPEIRLIDSYANENSEIIGEFKVSEDIEEGEYSVNLIIEDERNLEREINFVIGTPKSISNIKKSFEEIIEENKMYIIVIAGIVIISIIILITVLVSKRR